MLTFCSLRVDSPRVDSAPFDARIQEANERLAEARQAATEARDRLAEALVGFARQWIDARVEVAIRTKASRVQEMGVQGLRPLKADVEALKGRLPELVELEFVSGVNWRFVEGSEPVTRLESNPFHMHSSRPPKEFDNALRRIVGGLGAVLSSYELTDADEWRGGKYAHALNWEGDATAAGRAFADTYQEFLNASLELAHAEGDKDRAQAEDLWRNA